jgi:YD repeat-containing protein
MRLIEGADGRLASRRVRSNEQFFYTYDALGRVTNVNAPSGTADTSYTYNNYSQLATITSDGRTITNAYNALGDHLS